MTVFSRPRRRWKKSREIWKAGPYSYRGLVYVAGSEKDYFSCTPPPAEPRLAVDTDGLKKDEDLLSLTPDQISEKMISLGKRALDLPKAGLLHEVELQCLDQVLKLYQKSDEHLPNAALTDSFLKSISMICTAILNSGEGETFHFAKKTQIISIIKDILTEEPLQTSVRNCAFIAIQDLSHLKPSLSTAETNDIIYVSVNSILSLPQEEKMVTGSGSPKDPDSTESLFPTFMTPLETLMIHFLKKTLTAGVLMDMFEILVPWISSKKKWERERAMRICYVLLLNYSQRIARVPSHSHGIGYFLGLLAPYSSDSCLSVKTYCLQSFSCLTIIKNHLQGRRRDPANIASMTPTNISYFVWRYLDVADFTEFFRAVLKIFICDDRESSATAAAWVWMVLDELGPKLRDQVQEIVNIVQTNLSHVQNRKTFLEALQPIAIHQLFAVVESLQRNPFSSEKDAVDFWMVLLTTHNFTSGRKILNELMGMMNHETKALAIEATFVFNTMLRTFPASSCVVKMRFAEVFCTALQNITLTLEDMSQFVNSESPGQIEKASRSCRLAVDALKHIMLLGNIGNPVTLNQIGKSDCWTLLSNRRNHKDGVILLTRILIDSNTSEAKDIIKRLLSSLNSPCRAWRLTGISFFSEVMGHGILQGMRLTKVLINVMKEHSGDARSAVRALALRALGRVASFSQKKVKKYKGEIIGPLIKAIHGEKNSRAVKEIFAGLYNTLKIFKKKEIGKEFNIVAVQSRFFMDAEDANVRASAIKLFGQLGSMAKVKSKGFFAEQVRCCLGTLIHRMQDPNVKVFMVSVNALKICLPFLGSTALHDEFVRDPITVGYNHQKFLKRFFVPLHQDLPELLPVLVNQCLPYFCSTVEDKKLRDAAREMIATIEGVIKPDDMKKEQVMQLIAFCHTMDEKPVSSGNQIKNIQTETLGETSRQVEHVRHNQNQIQSYQGAKKHRIINGRTLPPRNSSQTAGDRGRRRLHPLIAHDSSLETGFSWLNH